MGISPLIYTRNLRSMDGYMSLAPKTSALVFVFVMMTALAFSNVSYSFERAPKRANTQQQKLVITSAQQASSRAQSQFGGKVLRVQSIQVGNAPGYQVKLLSSDGVVFYATVNAVTGSVRRN